MDPFEFYKKHPPKSCSNLCRPLSCRKPEPTFASRPLEAGDLQGAEEWLTQMVGGAPSEGFFSLVCVFLELLVPHCCDVWGVCFCM